MGISDECAEAEKLEVLFAGRERGLGLKIERKRGKGLDRSERRGSALSRRDMSEEEELTERES